MKSVIAATALLAASSLAAPPTLVERQDSGSSNSSAPAALTDPDILQFALTLEHLESTFYATALQNFTEADFNKAGFSGVRARIAEIAADEAQHVSFLTAGLSAAGATPVGESKYVWPGVTDVKSFLGLSQILEGVGVSAYLGAAPSVENKQYLAAAGSILTVEARHNAYIRYINGESPFPSPEDGALSPRSVVSLASAFFAPGAPNAPTGIAPFPSLTVTTSNPTIGQSISLTANTSSVQGNGTTLYCAFISGISAAFSEFSTSNSSCMVPSQNVTSGQTYVLLTSQPVISDASTVAGVGLIASLNDTASGTNPSTGSSSSSSSSGSGSSGSSSKSGAASVKFGAAGVVGLIGAGMMALLL